MTANVQAQTPEPGDNLGLIEQFRKAFEQRNIEAVTPLLAEDVVIVQPMTFSGSATPDFVLEGRKAVLGYFQQAFSRMGRIRFVSKRLSETRDGSVYYEANGDFTTADGRPYRNVYLFRFDIENNQVVHIAEYANPVIFTQTFGAPESQ